MKVSALLVLFCAALSVAEPRLKSSKQLKVFQEKGCANCHKIHNVSEYTDYGKWARDKGYGCTTLLSLTKLHNVKGPDMERAREVFVQNKCSVCHNVEGKGIGKENLSTYGLRMKKENLGCVALYKSLLGK